MTCHSVNSGHYSTWISDPGDVLQNRQRALPRGIARWCDRAYARLLARLRGESFEGTGTATPRAGVAEIEAVHACTAQALGRLRKLFGERLAVKAREATMYPELREAQVNVQGLADSVLGKVAT